MKKLIFSVLCLFSLSAMAQETKQINDANATLRSVSGIFTAISVSGGIELYLTQGDEEKVAVSASDDKYLARLKTELINGELKIYIDNKGISRESYNLKLKAYVTVKTLNKFKAAAGSQVDVNGSIHAENLDMNLSSGAQFKGAIQAVTLTADVSSGALVKISGKADRFNVDAGSGADFKGYEFAVDYCNAKASSGASVHITINKELNAKANGGGDIKYKGTALLRDIETSGGGAVKKV